MDKVVHFEIPADDIHRANKFYTRVFGWDIQKFPGQDMEYYGACTVPINKKTRMPKEIGAINGAIMKKEAPVKSITIAINVSSIDSYLKKVEAAGGKTVMGKTPVGDMGFYAYFKDTEGNIIGLWEAKKQD